MWPPPPFTHDFNLKRSQFSSTPLPANSTSILSSTPIISLALCSGVPNTAEAMLKIRANGCPKSPTGARCLLHLNLSPNSTHRRHYNCKPVGSLPGTSPFQVQPSLPSNPMVALPSSTSRTGCGSKTTLPSQASFCSLFFAPKPTASTAPHPWIRILLGYSPRILKRTTLVPLLIN